MDFLRDLLFLPDGGSTLADRVDLLHFFVIGVTAAGSSLVFLSGLWFMWRYPHTRRGTVTERITAPRWFEAMVIGGLLGLFLLWWVLGDLEYDRMRTPPDRTVDIHVVAKQWMWQFASSSGRRSQSVLVVPAHQDVRLVMTSRDVIHSLYVPAFRLKQDVLPGRYTSLWFNVTHPGTYDVYCAEYCGLSHSHMRARIVALDARDYARWLDGETLPQVIAAGARLPRAPEEDLAALGREVAVRNGCFSCHTVTGEPYLAPTWRGLYGSSVELSDGRRVIADGAYLTQSIMQPEIQVVRGYEPVMPSYHGILGAADVGAIVEYIRSLRAPATEPPPVALPEVRAEPAGGAQRGGER